jgi:hypothetical protein
MSNRVVHFEIHAADPQRAQAFYRAVFGWDFPLWMEQPPYWGVMTSAGGADDGPGINGGLMARRGGPPAEGAPVNGYVCTVQVDSFDETSAKIVDAGGTVAVPKHAIAGMAWQGYFKDTEGNIFGVHEADANAR